MKKTMQVFLVLIMLVTIALPVRAKDDQKAYQSLKNYHVYLQGHHSSDTAGIEGGLAVQGDSSFGEELQTFTYGSLFHPQSNHVGEDFSEEEKVSLLIAGKVNRMKSDAIISIPYQRKNDQIYGRFLATEKSYQESLDSFKNQTVSYLDKDQVEIFEVEEIGTFFKHLENENQQVTERLGHLSSSLKETGMETLGDMWLDGQLVTYDLYRSALDEKVMIINIPPQMVDGEYETIVHSLGLDLDDKRLQDIEQFIISSFTMDGVNRQHSQKIAFKGNFLYKKNGVVNVLPYEDTAAYASKIVHYFPEARQVTNFFDAKAYNLFQAPDSKQIDTESKGVNEEGKTLYHRDYLKQYATGNSSNGSAEYGGGSSIIGSMIAPKATVILSGSGLNGFLSAKNLHQRNGAGIQHFRNDWLFKEIEDESSSIHLFKYYTENEEEKALPGAKFKLVKILEGSPHYLRKDQTWTSDDEDPSTVFISDDQGEIHFKDLDFGTYYLWEIEAPDGFHQDKKTIQEINISKDAKSIDLKWENYKTEDLTRDIKIHKQASEDQRSLEGAEFIVRRQSEDPSRGGYEYLMQYESRKGEIIYRGFVKNILLATHFRSDKEGKIEIDHLPETPMEVLEVKAPDGYELPEDPVIKLPNGNAEIKIENKEEQKQLHSSVLKKIDQHEDQKALAGAEFVLSQQGFYYRLGNALEASSWTEDIDEAYRYVSDENGELIINTSDGLGFEEGDYALREVKAPKGYARLEDDFEIHIPSKKNYVIPNEKLGSIEIQKENTAGDALAGAHFVLMKDGKYYTDKVSSPWSNDYQDAKEWVSDENGALKIEKLRYGEYQIREVQAPEGYALLEEDLNLTVDDSKQNERYHVVNKKIEAWTPIEPRGSFEVQKTNLEGEALEAADFVLLHQDQYYTGDVDAMWSRDLKDAKTLTTDQEGSFKVTSLPYGSYRLREIKAPEGYQLLKDEISFEIDADNPSSSLKIENKKAIEWTPIEPRGSFEVEKTNLEAEALEDANFVLLHQNHYYTGDVDAMWTEELLKAKILSTNEKGHFKVNALPYAKYRLREVQAPEGYQLLKDEISFEIDAENPSILLKVENKKSEEWTPIEERGSLVIKKVNLEDETLEAADFVLLHQDHYYTGDVDAMWSRDLKDAKTLTTDKEGSFKVPSLPYGNYRLREIKAPEGYQLLREDISFSIDKDQSEVFLEIKNKKVESWTPIEPRGSFEVAKTNLEGVALEAADFVLLYQDHYYTGNVDAMWSRDLKDAKTLSTDQEGSIKVQSLPYGNYRLQEIKAPEGYQLLDAPIDFTIDAANSSPSLRIQNKKIEAWTPIEPRGSLSVQKNKEDGQALAGAEFVLMQNGQYYSGDVDAPWTNSKAKAAIFKSDSKGQFTINSLAYGDYTIREVKAPEAYQILKEDIPFAIHEEETSVNLTITNQREIPWTPIDSLGSFAIIKENEDSERLEGVQFILLNQEQYYTGNTDDLWTSNKEEAKVLKTDQNGYFKVSGLKFGEYSLREIQALEGYEKLKEDLSIRIDEKQEDAIYHLVNKKLRPWTPIEPRGSVEVHKTNTEGESLEGADFVLLQDDQYYTGDLDAMWTDKLSEAKILRTDAKGSFKVNSLPYGEYRLREIKAPEAYQLLEEDVSFTLDDKQNSVLLEIENKKVEDLSPIEPRASFEVHKTNTEGESLEGADFVLLQDDQYYTGDLNAMWTDNLSEAQILRTDAKGFFKVNSLPYGEYRLREIKAPEAYQLLEEDVSFTLDDKQNSVLLEIENKAIEIPSQTSLGLLRVYKEDGETGELLSGASFILKKDSLYYGSEKDFPWTSDRDKALVFTTQDLGYFEVKGLAYGDYSLLEVEAPLGYRLEEQEISFHLDEAIKEIRVSNDPLEIDLPETGISNTGLYVLIAIVLLGFALFLWSYRK